MLRWNRSWFVHFVISYSNCTCPGLPYLWLGTKRSGRWSCGSTFPTQDIVDYNFVNQRCFQPQKRTWKRYCRFNSKMACKIYKKQKNSVSIARKYISFYTNNCFILKSKVCICFSTLLLHLVTFWNSCTFAVSKQSS